MRNSYAVCPLEAVQSSSVFGGLDPEPFAGAANVGMASDCATIFDERLIKTSNAQVRKIRVFIGVCLELMLVNSLTMFDLEG
jgi:hypothetical protein